MSDFPGVKRVHVSVGDGYIFLGSGGEIVRGKVVGVYRSNGPDDTVVIHYESSCGLIALMTPIRKLSVWDTTSGGIIWCSDAQWSALREYHMHGDDE